MSQPTDGYGGLYPRWQGVDRPVKASREPIAVSNTSLLTCPSSCPLAGDQGCYAETGKLRHLLNEGSRCGADPPGTEPIPMEASVEAGRRYFAPLRRRGSVT
jgi:hypothetical protein